MTVPEPIRVLVVDDHAVVRRSVVACGACETRVLEGKPDHRDAVLTGEERAFGETMMICVSRARTPWLVLDL